MSLISCCRSWLREAQLGVTSADEAAPLLQNPLRNGLLLCDLAGIACLCRCFQAVHCILDLEVALCFAGSTRTELFGAFRQFTASIDVCGVSYGRTAECTQSQSAPTYKPQSSQIVLNVLHINLTVTELCRSFGRAYCVGSESQS